MTNRTDDFNRTTNVDSLGTPSDAGSAWVPLGSAVWGVNGNVAAEKNGIAQSVAYLEASVADAEVQATLLTVGSDSGLVARVVDNSNYLVATAGSAGYRLYKQVGSGNFTQIGSNYNTAAADGDVLKIRCEGNDITVYVNGVSRITGTDAAHNTATKFGLRANDNNAARFDDFSITGIGGGTSATANGATISAAASLIAGTASGAAGATAAGVTLTAAASLLYAGGTLRFQAAGMEFGARTGLGIGTFALDAAQNYRYTVHADGLVLGSALITSGVIATDSGGKLPDLVNTAIAPGVLYRVHAIRQADGEAATFRMRAQA